MSYQNLTYSISLLNFKMRPACKLFIVGVSSLFAVLFVRYVIVSKVRNHRIHELLRLEPGGHLWDHWTNSQDTMYSRFYFFNVTNQDDVINGQKPIVKEVGPYVYEEQRKKIILSVNEETVKFRPKTTWFYRHDLSFGSEDDNITLPNIPFIGISRLTWDLSKQPYVLSTIGEMLTDRGEKVFQTNQVKDLLFEGIPIQNYLEMLSLPAVDSSSEQKPVPENILDGDIGFFDDKNGTADDIWVINSGRTSIYKLGEIVSWVNSIPRHRSFAFK